MRFCGLFVLPCLAVLVPGGAFATLLSAAAAAADPFFERKSEVTLGIFEVQFRSFSVLHCHGDLPLGVVRF